MTEVVFKYRKPNINKLLSFGFVAIGNRFEYKTDFLDHQMELLVIVHPDGCVETKVTDIESEGEYTLHLVIGASGAFVGRVRATYESIVENIANVCFEPDVFKAPQTKAVANYVSEKYGDEVEHLWTKSPTNAIVRRKDTRKWYVAILTLSRRKLGIDSDELVEIIDLRMEPEKVESVVDYSRYFPGFHMNKKHWITICMDGSVSIDEIFDRIDQSYKLALK